MSRRRLLVGAACGAACVALPANRAAALTWLSLGRFVAGTVVSWVIEKALDYFWEHPESVKAAPLRSYFHDDPRLETTPSAVTGNVQAWFAPPSSATRSPARAQTLLHARRVDGERHGVVPSQFVRALDELHREEATLATAFAHWGPLDGEPIVGSPLDLDPYGGGSLIGVWWGMTPKGGRRFVVIRSTAQRAVYIPCANAYAEAAFRVVNEGQLELAKGRLTTLIVRPRGHRFNLREDAPGYS